jgi:NIPSNAP
MCIKKIVASLSFVAVFAAGYLAGGQYGSGDAGVAYAQSPARVFELRTYTAHEGRLADVVARFRDHTMRIFAKNGMTSVGYFTPQDAPLAGNTLVYILAHPSREAAKKNWDAFRNDPEWQKVKADTEANGPIVDKVVSVYIEPTSFSPLK